MKSWQFGFLLGHELLILSHLSQGPIATAFAVLALVMVVPSIVLCAVEVRR